MGPDKHKQEKENDDEFSDLIARMAAGLERLDADYPVPDLNPEALRLELERQRRVLRRKAVRDVAGFLSAAVLVLFLSVTVYLNRPDLFLPVQGGALAAGLLTWLLRGGRKPDERKVDL